MAYRESETLELKKSTAELREGVISVAAILNKHARGKLFFGVKNNGEIIGLDAAEKTLRDVASALAEHIEPRIYPEVVRTKLAGKPCIQVRFTGHDAPYLAYGRGYIRVADEDRQLSPREMEKLFLHRGREAHRWESEPSRKKLSDLSEGAVKAFVRRANQARRIDFAYASARSTLNKLDLIEGGRLRKAAEVLFCDENPMEVQAAVFAGTDKRTFLDIQQFRGTLFDLLEKSATYVKEHINWKVQFGGIERKEVPEIPEEALREALVNSLCHRDYRNPKGNEVAIFRDRVEIYNPGDFPEGYTPEDFIRGAERSILRNPLIADALFKSKDIERWGSGLKRIADACAEGGVKVQFQVLKSGFLVAFQRRAAKGYQPRGQAAGFQGTTQSATQKTTQKLLELIRRHPSITRTELSEHLDMTVEGVRYHLNRLKRKGIVRRVGPDKGGHWETTG